jgi:hypothetical protein
VNGLLETYVMSRIPPYQYFAFCRDVIKNVPSISVSALSMVDPFYWKIVHMPYWIQVILISLGIKRYQLHKL